MAKKITSLKDLTPDPQNANAGTERGQYLVEHSLESFGAGRSILADVNGVVIAGNKTLQAAADMGLEVEIVQSDGKKLVVVQRTDLDLMTDKAARELAYADNRASEVGLAWDTEQILADMQGGVDLEQFFRTDELEAILKDTSVDPVEDAEPQFDRAAELQAEWQTERGQVWVIPSLSVAGKAHRVMCGDSTSAEDVGRLMGGENPNLMVTDPPYGVEYNAGWRDEAAAAGLLQFGAARQGAVQNDDRFDWFDAIKLFGGNVIYCWHADLRAKDVAQFLENAGYEIRYQIIWAKPHFVIGRGHYHTRHEPCWYAVKKGQTADWLGDHSQDTLWQITLDHNVTGGHSTQKPLECMARPIRNHKGDVYDPFLGSGTTIVACEQTCRVGYGMEISPAYVAVILQRLKDIGLTPNLS